MGAFDDLIPVNSGAKPANQFEDLVPAEAPTPPPSTPEQAGVRALGQAGFARQGIFGIGDQLEQPPDPQLLSAQEIQKQGINPNLPSDLSQARAIQNAYSQEYAGGPTMAVEMERERQGFRRQENAERGVLASNVIEALHPAGEFFARGERLLAPAVGIVAPEAAANMQASAQQLEETRGNGGLASLPGQIVGSLATFANPLIAAASGANRAYVETEQEKAAGENISGWKEFRRVAGQGIIDAVLSKVFSAKPGAAPIAGKVEQLLARKLEQIGPKFLAEYGAKGAVGAITNVLGNEAGNVLFGRPVGTGDVESAVLGGALPIAHEAAGTFLGKMRRLATPEIRPETPVRRASDLPPEMMAALTPEGKAHVEEIVGKLGDLESVATEGDKYQAQYNRRKTDELNKSFERIAAKSEFKTPEELPITPEDRKLAAEIEDRIAKVRPPEFVQGEAPTPTPEGKIEPVADALAHPLPEGITRDTLAQMRARRGAVGLPSPDIKGAMDYGRDLIREVGKITGSDIGLTKSGVKVANDIRGLYGEQGRRAASLELETAPHVKLAERMPEAQAVQLIDEIGGGQPLSDPRFQKFADLHRDLAAGYEARAKALGWDTSKWTPDWIGRMFEFPDTKGKFRGDTGYSAKLAGSEGYLKGREFETYQEALAAVKAAGGRPKYDNPIKMALAKDIEVSNSLLAHEQFDSFLKSGDVREVKRGAPIQPGEVLIHDPLRWTHSDTRQFAASKDLADLLNHVSSESTSSKIADAVTSANRFAVRIQMAINLRHYMTESLGATQTLYGQAFKDLFRGQFVQAGKEFIYGAPGLGTASIIRKGKNLAPDTLTARAIAKGGGDVRGRSILKDGDWKAMHDAWDKGQGIKAGRELVGNVMGFANEVLFEEYIPNLRKGVAAIIAESEIAYAMKRGKGIDTPEFKATMNKHIQAISNMLGVEDSRIHFQNKTAATVGRMLFGLPNWFLGKVRFSVDALRGIAPLFSGENADPATYGVLGALATTGVVGSALYAAFNSGKMPTSWNDLRHVPTPWMGDDGKPIRITVPYPWEMISEVVTGERSIPETLQNRLSPLVKFAEEMHTGKDYRGAPTRETWGDVAKSLRDTMATPYSVSGFNRADLSPGFKVAALAGITPSAKKFGQSAAERFAYETIQGKQQEAPKTHEEIAQQDKRSAIIKALRKDDYSLLDRGMESGDVRASQSKALVKSAQTPRGLVGLIDSHELSHQDLMKVWEKATPDEKKAVYDPLYSRLAKETSLSPDDKERLLDKLDQEMPH